MAIALSTPDVSKDVPGGNAFTDARTNVTRAQITNGHSHLTCGGITTVSELGDSRVFDHILGGYGTFSSHEVELSLVLNGVIQEY